MGVSLVARDSKNLFFYFLINTKKKKHSIFKLINKIKYQELVKKTLYIIKNRKKITQQKRNAHKSIKSHLRKRKTLRLSLFKHTLAASSILGSKNILSIISLFLGHCFSVKKKKSKSNSNNKK